MQLVTAHESVAGAAYACYKCAGYYNIIISDNPYFPRTELELLVGHIRYTLYDALIYYSIDSALVALLSAAWQLYSLVLEDIFRLSILNARQFEIQIWIEGICRHAIPIRFFFFVVAAVVDAKNELLSKQNDDAPWLNIAQFIQFSIDSLLKVRNILSAGCWHLISTCVFIDY